MITPIEGTPVNELQTSLPDYRTSRVASNFNELPQTKPKYSQGLENFNNFVKNISQEDTNKQVKTVDYDKIAKKLKEIINDESLMIQFTRDDQTKKMIFKLINSETKEVVQQIPPEVALKIARYIASTLEDKNVANAKV
ncbi:MAG: flagellar protein FlaG [Ignavibacteria bacterium]|nr:flagellar protein FlaG [Ignavibacteria bacterium]